MVASHVASVAPARYRIGRAKSAKSSENSTAAASPNQNDTAAISRAASVCFLPSARDKALAPPTPKRLEIAVSITNEEYDTVTAAV